LNKFNVCGKFIIDLRVYEFLKYLQQLLFAYTVCIFLRVPISRWSIYERIWWAVSISRSEQPVKLISAVKRAENGEIGAGILDLRIFGSIIGNMAGESSTNRSTDRQIDRISLVEYINLHSGLYHIP